MIYIDLENNPPSQDWINRADAITQELIAAKDEAARNIIIDKNENLWKELKEHLAALSNNKCWYTESINAAAHCHVDHFRPKKEVIDENNKTTSGYWWLAFDWLNYRFAGPAPNVRKKSYFHVIANRALNYGDVCENEDILLLDPIDIDDPDELAFTNEGLVEPKSIDTQSRNFKKVSYSIKRLNLNAATLIDVRKDKYSRANGLIIRINRLLTLQNQNFDISRKNEIGQLIKILWEMCSRKSEFSAAVKFCLKSSGLDWALAIIAKAA
ncbi:hypothetical protein LJC57_01815 [Parabacteroides sp. OttesenSCG-928-G07]|nr:hypothetical protein [Parabacteroides sp. OttesenSCG-928-G21]MDL2277305.1 hypothetical protein [Parabacteroides sp. OttesenSCG-928-G07]